MHLLKARPHKNVKVIVMDSNGITMLYPSHQTIDRAIGRPGQVDDAR